MKPKAVKYLDQIVFIDANGDRHVANVAKVHSDTMINVIYQTGEGVQTAASVPHKSVNKSGAHFIHPDEEKK